MKKIFNLKAVILALLLAATGSTATFAQCDKKVTFTATLTTYLNNKGEVEKTKNEETVVTLDKKEINITTGGNPELSGVVKSYICNWADAFKTGKTVIVTEMTDGGTDLHTTITIEGKDGKITLTFEAAEMPGKKIVLVADKFE